MLRPITHHGGPSGLNKTSTAADQPNATGIGLRGSAVSDPTVAKHTALKVRIHQRLLEVINLSALEDMDPERVRQEVGSVVQHLLQTESIPLTFKVKEQLVHDILDEVLGLGPLEPLIKDPTISDILVNTYSDVYIERAGKIEETEVRFKDEQHLRRIIQKIVSAVGRRVDESQPMVDARLPDGSRVNAVLPPIAVDGSLLSIRKFARVPFDLPLLVANGTITDDIAQFLSALVRARLNVLISGGTGSGKTTLLNAMSHHIGDRERIVTIEDAAELQLQQRHIARMETRPANIEGRGEIVQRDLVKNALRMRPDRIIVGEVRAGEAFDMLQAMNTGHDGSMTTIHANSCRDSLSRLEQMIGMAGFELPTRSVRSQIASALDVVLQLERMSDGGRRLVSVHEITGMEGDIISMQEIFRFVRHSVDEDGKIHGSFQPTGIRPKFADQFKTMGIEVHDSMFGGRSTGRGH